MKSCQEETHLSTTLSLAVVFGGYSLASLLHTSGPLAMVVAGLVIGNKINQESFNAKTRENLSGFWKILDESLNGVLFVFLGLALHLIPLESPNLIFLVMLAILLVLVSRFISVFIPYSLLKHSEDSWDQNNLCVDLGRIKRGNFIGPGIFPGRWSSPEMSYLLLTYGIVIFSILIQGLSISP